MRSIDPVAYARTRNYVDGAVTRLSPYISRGVISTRKVYAYIKSLGLPWNQTEKLVQELAWRDYWQQVWLAKGDLIKTDLRNTQYPVAYHGIPQAVLEAKTGINAVDQAIQELYRTGYMHNHMRMYVASICCNIAQAHWFVPAKWLYFHLLDGDLASNHLSWQWVAGTNSNKKYFANQENINTYFNSKQRNTFLDVGYDQFDGLEIPEMLQETGTFDAKTILPVIQNSKLDSTAITLIYNYYNLDPDWHKGEAVQRVLLLEPSFFEEYPVSAKNIEFVLKLAKNIEGIKLFVGEFSELQHQLSTNHIYFKEHPANRHYQGREESRDWMCDVFGYFPSFFAFWKKCKNELTQPQSKALF